MPLRDWLVRDIFREPADAPQGGGGRGFLNRFGTGFRQGIMPNNQQLLTRGVNPLAYLFGGLLEGGRDAVTGSNWWQSTFNRGSQLPSWMQYPSAGPLPQNPYQANWPGAGTWPGQDTAQENPYYGQGQGMMRMPGGQRPTRRPGVGGGSTIAQGQAAQDMFEGMREGARQSQLDEAQRRFRDRMMSMYQ